ncbi:type IV secretory system conjugative DNA transfer family protein [Legionella sp. CNM-4043-24]|uniref:type IV secretory system conjugative DNA transfer family protein n=1 Tax=Legionella sp. CNM-4043-24 TaxID=3421646 RepID=UPI00403A7F44
MRPEKIMRMPSSQTLIMRTGFSPVKTEQFIWYREKKTRVLKNPEIKLPMLSLTA